MTALTIEELLAWLDHTSAHWQALLTDNPEALTLPCDIRESESVADLLQHIVAVELRYAERLADQPETPYSDIPSHSADVLFRTHAGAVAMIRHLLTLHPAPWWESSIPFTTRRGGHLTATRRTILVHALMHSIRHYAQLATLMRQHGITPAWPMDYLFMAATPGPAAELTSAP